MSASGPDLDANVKRTVGLVVLGRLSSLARDERTREADAARLARRIAWGIALGTVAGLIWLSARIFK